MHTVINPVTTYQYLLPHIKSYICRLVYYYLSINISIFEYFSQNGAISFLNGKPLKLVHQSIYLGSSVLSYQ